MSVTFRDFDLERYAGLLRRLVPAATGFAVCDTAGQRRWSSACSDLDQCIRAVALLNQGAGSWASTDTTPHRRNIDDDSTACTLRIDPNDPAAGTLMALLPAGCDGEGVCDSLAAVAECIAGENGFLMELDAMATELGERYEELNLIYITDDNVKYFDEGQDALRRLVQNTGRFLDAGLVALVKSDREVITTQAYDTNAIPEVERVIRTATREVYDRVDEIKDTVVFNETGVTDAGQWIDGIDCRLMADPIFDQNGSLIGVLLIANRSDSDDFRASDAKLLRVMSRKAARIIQVNYDSLTGMMTRHGFEYHLETALYIVRYKRVEHCVLHINLDRVHIVNDSCSHHAGDELIRRVAACIREQLGEGDIVARISGDRFGVLMADCTVERGCETADRIRQAVSRNGFNWDKRRFDVSVSIGVASMAPESESIVSVLGASEVACGTAKKQGRNRVEVYERDSQMLMRRRAEAEWVGHLHNALREDRFVLYSQRIVSLQNDDRLPHAEILLRLRNENDQILAPGEFVPAAERYNLMPAIDRWVVRNTLKTLAAHLPHRIRAGNVWAINLSGQSICEDSFLEFVLREVEQAGVPASSLCFEITETAAVAEVDKAKYFLGAMRERGFRFALDDFGTGLSSLSYLKTLPVDYLKIDGSFVREIATDPISRSMVSAITLIAGEMGLETIGEFVENEEIRDCAAALGVTYGQGFAIERPRPLLEMVCELSPH